jgi:hypothetical protein
MHGHGKYFYKNGDLYDGEWLKNTFHGRGTFYEEKSGYTLVACFIHGICDSSEPFSIINRDGDFLNG